MKDFAYRGKEDKIGLADSVRPWTGPNEGSLGGWAGLSGWVTVGVGVVVAQGSAIAVVGTVCAVAGTVERVAGTVEKVVGTVERVGHIVGLNGRAKVADNTGLNGRVMVGGNTGLTGRVMAGGKAGLSPEGGKTCQVREACRELCSRLGVASSWEDNTIGPDFEGGLGLCFGTGSLSVLPTLNLSQQLQAWNHSIAHPHSNSRDPF